MKTSSKAIRNERLGLDLAFHIVSPSYTTNSITKTINGSVMSFKSNLVLDAVNNQGNLQHAHSSGFTVPDVDLSNPEKSISDFIDANIEAIVSK